MKSKVNSQPLNPRRLVLASLFTALIVVGGYLSVPLPFSPVPLALADFFVMLSGLLLGSSLGLTSTACYLLLGALGLPVFAGGKAGLAVFLGPTGGFLIGYMVAAWLIGIIATGGRTNPFKDGLALLAGNIVLHVCGVSWLVATLHLSWGKALAAGVLPFLPGAVIKGIAAVILARVIRPQLSGNDRRG